MAGFDWGALAGAGLGIGSVLAGQQQSNRANQLSQQNANRLFDLAAQEQARKDSLTRSFLPAVAFGMGAKNPIGVAQKAYPSTLPTSGSSQFSPSSVYGNQQQSNGPGIGSALMTAGASTAPTIAKALGVGAAKIYGPATPTVTAGGMGGGFGGTMTGLLTNPITIGAGAAAAGGAAWLKSQAHWEANDVVKNLQNPYHQKVLAPLSSGVANGSISPQQGIQELDRTWTEYQQELQRWAGTSSDRNKVAQQSLATLTPLIQQMRADMAKQGGQ